MTTVTNAASRVAGPAGMLHVDDGGSGGVPVVLLHSFGGSSIQWAAQLEHLRETRHAVAFDLRGHGRSDAPADGNYAVDAQAADVGAVLDGLALTKVVLAGHGLGAKVAIEYAGSHPDRIAGLLLVAAPARVPVEQVAQIMAAMESDYETTSESINSRLLDGASPNVRAVVMGDLERMSKRAGLGIIRASLEHDPVPALKRYPGPKLAVTTPDADTPNDLHRLVDDLPREEVGGTSHWIQMDKPDVFNLMMDKFLQGVGGS